jgi:glucan phosphoethanolaminetransferase (alkaline phosphatase superfamily)
MKNYKKAILLALFAATMIFVNELGVSRTPFIIKIIVLIIAPIYLIWLVMRFSKPSKAKKYRIILYSSAGIMFYIAAICSLIDRYYNEFFQRNIMAFRFIGIGGLFTSVIVMALCYVKVKENENQNML